jgi:glycolate oxidase
MALSKDIIRELEDVVGEEFICCDPAIMPSYHGSDLGAVVLPENTAQVQAIIKTCNKYKLQFSAVSTGWTGSFKKDIVYIDMRRMNRIIEINEKNMYAVIEPYVITAELQAECFKKGLHFNVKGAGSNCSAMLRGHGHLDQSTSGDDRNHLAIEWVTPEGEIVRSGALGSTDEWFCGDGPGPSIRAILTSAVPPGVTPGVFTKAAIKLYHWPGPPRYDIQGVSPKYTLPEVPKNMMARYYSFPSVEKMWQAEIRLGENEICMELMGFNVAMVAANITTCNEDDEKVFKKLDKEKKGPGFFVIVAGNSDNDFAFKKKALEQIVKEAEGESMKSLEDPETEGILIAQCTRISASIRETFRAGGAFSSIPIMGQRDLTIKWAIGAGEAKLPLIKAGHIVDDGGAFFGWGVEQGHVGKTEIFCKFDPANEKAKAAVEQWSKTQGRRAFDESYFALMMGEVSDDIKAKMCHYDKWWIALTRAFDPNDVAPQGGPLV